MYSMNTELWIQPRVEQCSEEMARPSSFLIPLDLGANGRLLLNGLTGAIDLFTQEEFRWVGLAGDSATMQSVPPALVQRGHWLAPVEEQRLVAELTARIEAERRCGPMFFFLCPTNFCPMGCAYCIEGAATHAATRTAMSPEMVGRAFDTMEWLGQRCRRELGHVLLFGGEPLQAYCWDTVHAILTEARRRHIELFIFTNGLDLERYAPILGESGDVVTGVSVTLDGSEAYHNAQRAVPDAFARAVRGIERLAEAGATVQIRTNVSRAGIDQVPWLRDFYQRRGWWRDPRFSFELAPLTNHGCRPTLDQETITHYETASFFYSLLREDSTYGRFRFVGMFSYLYYVLRELQLITFPPEELGAHVVVPRVHGCPANTGATFTLVSDGSLHACNEQTGSDDVPLGTFWPEFTIDDRLIEAWLSRTVTNLPECRTCAYRFFCGGGCSLSATKRNDGDLQHGTCDSLKSDFQRFFQSIATDIVRTVRK